MSHKIEIVLGGYLDENNKLMDRQELNKRIVAKDEEIDKLKSILHGLKDMLQDLHRRKSKSIDDV